MLHMQWKLFWSSKFRVLIVCLLFLGCIYYYYPAFIAFFNNEPYYASLGVLQRQLLECIYVFILFLFLSYDFFREMQDSSLGEVLKIAPAEFVHDGMQASILFFIVVAYAIVFVLVHVLCHVSDGTLWKKQIPVEENSCCSSGTGMCCMGDGVL